MASELLSDTHIRNAKPKTKPSKLKDGKGLYVLIHPNGSKYFQLRFTLFSKDKTLQLGIYPDMSLADAREAAARARKLINAGIDPVHNKRVVAAQQADDAANTFKAVAEKWLAVKLKKGLSQKSYKNITGTFNANVYPRIGSFPVKDITPALIHDALVVMEKRGVLVWMHKTRYWIRSVFNHAIALQYLDRNPLPDEDELLANAVSENFPYLKSRADAGRFLRNLVEYTGRDETRLAIWIQMLVATRPGELRFAAWSEFDLEKGIWTIPHERLKSRKHVTEDFVVMLSNQAIVALNELHTYTGYTQLLFPSINAADKPMSDMTLGKALRTIWPDYRIVPHAFRHLFSTMANESGHFRSDVIETALAHKDKNAIRGTYNKATYMQERRELAQWWADELDAMRDGGKVLSMKFDEQTRQNQF